MGQHQTCLQIRTGITLFEIADAHKTFPCAAFMCNLRSDVIFLDMNMCPNTIDNSIKTAPSSDLAIRDAEFADIPAITAIYRHHVLNGTASFEEVAPDEAEIGNRFRTIREKSMPYLVATIGDAIVGYCYASTYRPRTAYRHTVENSVYVAHNCVGQGKASISLHERHGFEMVGTFKKVGYKFDRWLDSVLMQRPLGDDSPIIPKT